MSIEIRSLHALALATCLAVPAAAQTAGGPSPAAAQAAGTPSPATATFADPSTAWHLYGGFGFGAADGKYGDVLQKPLQWQLRIAKQSPSGAWRFGVGLMFGSMDPADDPNIPPETLDLWLPDEEWARLETSFSVTRVFRARERFRPYLLANVAIQRIHPRSALFYNKPPEGLEPGESPTYATNGVGFTIQPGFEWSLGKTLSLDVAGFYTYYNTGSYDMSPLGLPDVDSGVEWGARAGLAWQPFSATPRDPARKAVLVDPATGQPLPLPPPDGHRDAWGVPRSWGWATAEMFAINFGASAFNEYVRDANFNQISPAQLLGQPEGGLHLRRQQVQDQPARSTRSTARPTSTRRARTASASGARRPCRSPAPSSGSAAGRRTPCRSTTWSRPASGASRAARSRTGSPRSSSTTRSAGKGRVGREAAAFLFDPIRGFNRLVTGDASEVKGNPADRWDWRPDFQLTIRGGARVIGEGESITENTNTYGFLEWVLNYGDPWDGKDHHRPYDRFDVHAQSNFGDKTRLGRLLIRGDIFTKPLGNGTRQVLTLQQDFDYIDNEAFEYGGQALGPALLSLWKPSGKLRFFTRVQAYGILLGGVNSDYSQLADVANQERIREYDYGPGLGGAVELYLQRKNLPLLTARYRYSYLNVSNGSIYTGETASGAAIGLDSDHDIHQANVKLEIPIGRSLTIGADGSIFLRRSRYNVTEDTPEFGEAGRRTITQRNPEIRAFVAWTYNH